MGVSVTCQHDRRVNFLAGQVAIQAGHCLITGHYFEHCKYLTSPQQKNIVQSIIFQKKE